MKVRLPLLHARAKSLALFFAQVGPPGAKVAVYAAFPAVLHAFTHVRAPTRAARKHGHADPDENCGPQQMHKRGVYEAIVLEHPKHANGDEGERKNAHGSLQKKKGRARAR
jgi:hypothetical protein